MTEPKAQPGWLVVDHFIQGCTPEMIDWWWVNMEKGYELWCPDEHKGFKWEVLPPLGKHIGALQIAKESIDYGPVRDLRIAWLDPNTATPEIKDWLIYKHVLTAGGTGPGGGTPQINLTHQWEAVPGGCKMRSTMHRTPGPPPGAGGPPPGPPPGPHPSGKKPTGGGWPAHNVAEVSTFKTFLPALYWMWQAIPDPAINRKSNFVLKKDGSRLYYD
jgi:hypothetical protein